MSKEKPPSRFIYFTVTLLLLFCCFVSVMSSGPDVDDEDDLKAYEELLALDEEEEQQGPQVKSAEAEAEVLSKAQRIVIELNTDNTKRVINDNEFVLVLGYAPWCVRSADLMPRFAEAATALKEMGSPLLLAKLDAERYPKAASSLGIKGFPTLLLFVNGTSQAYTGGFSAEDIMIWSRKKTGSPTIRLASVAEAEEFLKKNAMFVIGLFERFEGPYYEKFVKAATADNEIQFVEASTTEVAKVLFPDIKPKNHFLGLVKSEPEKYSSFEDSFEKDKILQFLEYNKFPLVTILTELNSMKVYSSPIKFQVFIFAEANYFKKVILPLQDVARKFKSKILFVYVDTAEDNLAKPFLTLFGLEESDDTVVTAFDNRINSKYLLESDLTPKSLEEFCSGLLNGTLSPYFKSEPIPNNNGAIVQTIVGRTFDDLVLSSPQDVLLEVHTPWCLNCETTNKQIEKLAKHFKKLDNLIFAKIDASSNEHPKLQINDYPTLLFYPSGNKSNPIKLSTKSSLKDLAAFINKNVKGVEDKVKSLEEKATKDEL